jgi:Cof subfamily protein (haloacid dehalogenase superfamily)
MSLNYDLIALDVDGTLLRDDHVLTEAIREAVQETAVRGAQIVLCTGRGPSGALPILSELGLGGTVITHNGAATIKSEDRSIINEFAMEPGQLIEFVRYCREHGLHFDVNTAFDIMVEQLTPEAALMYSRFHAEPIVWNFEQDFPQGLVKFTAAGPKAQLDLVEKEWGGWSNSLKAIRSGDLFIDVHHMEANKGMALQQLAESRGIEPRRILAIGNYYNDMTMLQYAGMGIAMGNSPDAVKQAAKAVAPSNSEDGVAYALRQYAWS